MKKLLYILSLLFICGVLDAQAIPPVLVMKTKITASQPSDAAIATSIAALIDVSQYREVKTQLIRDEQGQPSHYLVYLHSKTLHRVDFAKIPVDAAFKALSVQQNYQLQPIDFNQQPGIEATHAACPDPSIQFIAFAPNDIQLEQDVTLDVANAASAVNLKTIKLLKAQATHDAYLSYMSCPQLRGNFYDGDANPQVITTVDGVISATEINTVLNKKFNYRVTNIWLACEAYNDPMLSAVINGAQARKYGAGINNLAIGPSDNAGACAMKAFIAGQPMTAAFNSCYKQFDTASDHWGFGGSSNDNFWSDGNGNWKLLGNNTAVTNIIADGNDLYQLDSTGKIWKYTGTPLTGWAMLDNNTATKKIMASGGNLYQLHSTGKIWKYTGTPVTGWQLLDNNAASVDIIADGNTLYQLHNTGKIWKYTGTPLTGWQMLDNNAATKKIAASGGNLYQLHSTGKIWKYTGKPVTGWQMLDNNAASINIVADGTNLYQLHNTGKIWKYTGTPLTGWKMLDNNAATKAIAAANGNLYQLHNTGLIWKYVGTPVTGWQFLDNNSASIDIKTGGSHLYQLHKDGSVWTYTQ